MVTHTALGASLIALALLQAPAAPAVEPIETKWRESIETDLRNGDPAGDVCAKAKRRASISDDVAFKTWAYDIARRTCPPGTIRGQGSSQQPRATPTTKPVSRKTAPATYVWGCPLISAHDAKIIARGQRLRISAGDCVMSFN